ANLKLAILDDNRGVAPFLPRKPEMICGVQPACLVGLKYEWHEVEQRLNALRTQRIADVLYHLVFPFPPGIGFCVRTLDDVHGLGFLLERLDDLLNVPPAVLQVRTYHILSCRTHGHAIR